MRKRIFDVVVGTLLALAVLPVMLLCAIGCAIALRTSPFFVQTRVGRDGQWFRFVKLRTLPRSTPSYASKYELNPQRVPRFTWWLRQVHLDELPQLFLVPLGKMSLVGPRPEMPGLHDELHAGFAAQRTQVRPGCTGLWQISQQNHRLIGESPEFDRFYLDHRTLRLDLWIVLRSVRAVLPNDARITLDDVPAWTGVPTTTAPSKTTTTIPALTNDLLRIDLEPAAERIAVSAEA